MLQIGTLFYLFAEPVTIILELQNPLHIPIIIGKLRLECAFVPLGSNGPVDAAVVCSETDSLFQYQGFLQRKLPPFLIPASSSTRVVPKIILNYTIVT